MIFQNHSFSFSLYCIFSQGKMCILEDLQQEPGFMEEETEWTGLYWSLILQQENHIVDNLTAIRPYGDCSYSNLKFSCVQFCGSPHYNFLLEVFHFLWASKWVLKSCKIITKQITNIFCHPWEKDVPRVQDDTWYSEFFFSQRNGLGFRVEKCRNMVLPSVTGEECQFPTISPRKKSWYPLLKDQQKERTLHWQNLLLSKLVLSHAC